MKRRRGALTPLSGIRPDLEGPAGRLLAARRRWQDLAGPKLAQALPLLACEGRRWIIGLPSPSWEAALRELASRLQGTPGAPVLISRQLPEAEARTATAPPLPAPAGTPAEKLDELRRRLEARRRERGES